MALSRVGLVVALGLAILGPVAPAAAHAFLVRSAPAARASLSRSPERVQLWFNERLEPAYSSVSVWGEAGARVDEGNGRVSAEDPRRLDLPLDSLPPGKYVIRFRVLSVDGHIVESSIPFAIKPATR